MRLCAQKPLLTATSALIKLLTYKQRDDVSMSEYIKTFKEVRDVFTTQWGKNITDYFVEQQPEYKSLNNANEKAKMKEDQFDEWIGLLFMLNADWRKYGSIKNELAASYTRGRDEYPKSLKSAIDYLDTHVTDSAYKEYKKLQKKKEKDKGGDAKSKSETSFAQKTEAMTCYCCGDKSHKSPECPLKDKVKKTEWFKKTGMVPKQAKRNFAQSEEEEDESDDDDSTVTSVESSRSTASRKSDKKETKCWSNFMIQPKQFLMNKGEKEELKKSKSKLNDVIILDTGSTIPATIANPNFITNLKSSKESLRMATNTGTKELNLKGEVFGFGDAWYDPEFMANIFSFSHMKDKYRITYDSKVDDAFHVHTKDGVVKFGATDEGLYAYKPSKRFLKEVAKTKNKVL